MAERQTEEIRVIAHFDIDCFYAQSEELRCPSLRGRPVGVTQKYLVVTCNYVARGLGVPKMVSIDEARRKLPTLVLVNGEDLTPYRADSKRIMAVMKRFGTVERQGLDEGAVDITAQVQARLQSGPPSVSFSGHVLGLDTLMGTNTLHGSSTSVNFEVTKLNCEDISRGDISLLVGSQVVAEMRTVIEKETGFHCSCGIAQNKMLAKLASSLNKPSMQTCLLPGAVTQFLTPLSVRKIPGVGKQMQGVLTDMGVETISDLKNVNLKKLSERLGERIAFFLFNACRGQDLTPVQDKGPPKSISVEDSFRKCQSMQHAQETLLVLAPDLIRRLDEDREETSRRPKTFTLKWHGHSTKWNFTSASTQMPRELLLTSMAIEKRASIAVDVAMRLLSRNLVQPFNLAVLNIGATNFVNESAMSSPGACDIRSFLQGQGKSNGKHVKVISKRDARALRESFKPKATTVCASAASPPSVAFHCGKLETKYGFHPGKGNLYDWDASLATDVEDECLLNDSEGEEVDLIGNQSSLSVGQTALNRMDVGTSHYKDKNSSFYEHEDVLPQLANSSYRSWHSMEMGLSGKKGIESGKLEKAGSGDEVKGVLSSFVNTLDDKPQCTSKELDPETQAVPVSADLFHGAMELSGAHVQDCSSLIKGSRPDTQDRHIKSESQACSIEIKDGTLDLSTSKRDITPDKTSTLDMSFFRQHALSPVNSFGNNCSGDTIEWGLCEECGVPVEESNAGRQEHADYHFALTLDKQEKHHLKQIPGSSRLESMANVSKLWCPPLKRPKSMNGTLDGFVLRRT